MTTNIPHRDEQKRLTPALWNDIVPQGNEYGQWLQGAVNTWGGIVSVYSQSDSTWMEYVRCGKVYRRSWDRGFKSRQLVNLAKRFAADVIIAQEPTP